MLIDWAARAGMYKAAELDAAAQHSTLARRPVAVRAFRLMQATEERCAGRLRSRGHYSAGTSFRVNSTSME